MRTTRQSLLILFVFHFQLAALRPKLAEMEELMAEQRCASAHRIAVMSARLASLEGDQQHTAPSEGVQQLEVNVVGVGRVRLAVSLAEVVNVEE